MSKNDIDVYNNLLTIFELFISNVLNFEHYWRKETPFSTTLGQRFLENFLPETKCVHTLDRFAESECPLHTVTLLLDVIVKQFQNFSQTNEISVPKKEPLSQDPKTTQSTKNLREMISTFRKQILIQILPTSQVTPMKNFPQVTPMKKCPLVPSMKNFPQIRSMKNLKLNKRSWQIFLPLIFCFS